MPASNVVSLSIKSPTNLIGGDFVIWGIELRQGLERWQHPEADTYLHADNQHTHGGGHSQRHHAIRSAIVVGRSLFTALPHQRYRQSSTTRIASAMAA